jgi:hypothetical protein
MVTDGMSIESNQPWSRVLSVRDIHTDGNVTVGTFTEKIGPGSWSTLVLNVDTLFMHR